MKNLPWQKVGQNDMAYTCRITTKSNKFRVFSSKSWKTKNENCTPCISSVSIHRNSLLFLSRLLRINAGYISLFCASFCVISARMIKSLKLQLINHLFHQINWNYARSYAFNFGIKLTYYHLILELIDIISLIFDSSRNKSFVKKYFVINLPF